MNTARLTVVTASAALVLLSTAASAFAVSAFATTAANVRSGPGTGYAVVDALATGEEVDVEGCNGSWCKIQHVGPDGWVSKSLLAAGGYDAPAPTPVPATPDLPFNFGVTVGPGGPAFSFGIGDGPLPAPIPVSAEVCFYKSSHFNGAQFCVSPGDDDASLPGGWNDSISSIRVSGGAEVTVCTDFWYGGACTTYHHDKANLGSYNNAISSYQAF